MEWTRSPLMRALALAASVGLVVVHWDDRGRWFWIGVALTVLNLLGIWSAKARAGRPDRPDRPGDPEAVDEESGSHRLVELLSLPGVAAALAEGPPVWQQVSYLDDPLGPLEPMPVEELAEYIWLERDHGWAIGLGDELKPYLDLDVPEEEDPVVAVLKSHPAVEDAYHEDREVYRVEQRGPISTEELAELAARALVSHHVDALRR
jgi:hypothetical protein